MENKKFDKIAYDNEYIKNNYDVIKLTVPKGGKPQLQGHAISRGEKLNAFIRRAIRETMMQDGGDVSAWDALAPDRVED